MKLLINRNLVKLTNWCFRKNKVFICLIMVLISSCHSIDSLYKLKNDYLKNKQNESFLKPYKEQDFNSNPLVEYVIDGKDSLSLKYFNHYKKLCDYTKIPFNFKTVQRFNTTKIIENSTRVLIVTNTKPLSKDLIPVLLKFVSNGGSLLIPSAIEDHRFLFFIGVQPKAELEFDVSTKGFFLETKGLVGETSMKIYKKEAHFGYHKDNFSDKTKVLLWSDQDKKMPLLLQNNIGLGRVLYYNTSQEFFKKDRGLLFSALLKGISGIPYPVANTSTIFLDDFPSPLFNDKKEPIKTEFNLTGNDYVTKIWWPDMKKLAKDYGLKYTAMTTFDYDDNLKAPFSFKQWDFAKYKLKKGKFVLSSNLLSKNVLKENFELGFHGYNHISLTKKEWKDPLHIVLSLKAVKKKWLVNDFFDYPVTYVPPSNIIDKYGIDNLKKGMESLTTFSSLYIGDLKEGGDREFDFEPYNKGFFDYPRISSGFTLHKDEKYDIFSTFLYTGIWTHFVHPDDVYQIRSSKEKNKKSYLYDFRNENGLFWKKGKKTLLGTFTNFVKGFKKIYPQARFYTARDATPKVINWRASSFTYNFQNNLLTVGEQTNHFDKDGTTWFVYFDELNPTNLSELNKQSNDYSINDFFDGKLIFLNAKNRLSFTFPNHMQDSKIEKEVVDNYQDFIKERYQYLFSSSKTMTEKDFLMQIEKEKERLLKIMLESPEINYEVWNKYAYYMSWDDRGDEVWELLDKHCTKYPSKHNINYSFELSKILGYSSEKLHKHWIHKQYQWNKDNLSVLKEYLAIIITTKEYEEIGNVLSKILELEPTCDNEEAYVNHLLFYEKEKAFAYLEKKDPSTANYNDYIVSDICWTYINEKEDYQSAINWADYSTLIGFATKLSWMFELKQYVEIEEAYNKYISQHPEDDMVRAKMFYLYESIGKYDEAYKVANEIQSDELLDELIPHINNNAVYIDLEILESLINKYPKLFTEETTKKIREKIKLLYGDYIDGVSTLSLFVKQVSDFRNTLEYCHFDKKRNSHSFKVQQNDLYSLDGIDNPKITVLGVSYGFNSKPKKEKNNFTYSYGAGLEKQLDGTFFYTASVGLSLGKKKSYLGVNLDYRPVQFKDSYEAKIYQAQFNLAYNKNFKYFGIDSYFESNYYQQVDLFSSSINLEVKPSINLEKKFRFYPFINSFYQTSNAKEDVLITPIYLIRNRGFSGLGLELNTGNEFDKFKGTLSGGYYIDSFVNRFINIRSNFDYRFLKFTSLKAGCDLNLESQYYFNTFNLGIKHIF